MGELRYDDKRDYLLKSLGSAYRKTRHRSTAESIADLNERRAAQGKPPIHLPPERKQEKP